MPHVATVLTKQSESGSLRSVPFHGSTASTVANAPPLLPPPPLLLHLTRHHQFIWDKLEFQRKVWKLQQLRLAANADAFGDIFAQQEILNEAQQRERKHARLRGRRKWQSLIGRDEDPLPRVSMKTVMHFIFDRREQKLSTPSVDKAPDLIGRDRGMDDG
eukprot:scaffold111041_cov65-Attheya_sp.AAC.2